MQIFNSFNGLEEAAKRLIRHLLYNTVTSVDGNTSWQWQSDIRVLPWFAWQLLEMVWQLLFPVLFDALRHGGCNGEVRSRKYFN